MLRIAEDADCHVGLCPPRNDVLIGSWTFCFGAAVWVGCTAERSMPVPYIVSPRMILQKCVIAPMMWVDRVPARSGLKCCTIRAEFLWYFMQIFTVIFHKTGRIGLYIPMKFPLSC